MIRSIRKHVKVKNHRIMVDLPKDFSVDDVDVIIVPRRKKSKKNNWQDILKSVSVWDIKESDIKIPSWKIEKF